MAGAGDRNALGVLLDYNPLNSLASAWIDDLERQTSRADPLGPLRRHLDAHLQDWSAATYEEWAEEALVALDGWDRGSAVVDGTFYAEGSQHRRVWNERMAAEDEDAGGDGEGGGGGAGKRYVPAREKTPSKAPKTAATAVPTENAAFVASRARVAAAAAGATKTAAATVASGKAAGEDPDLAGLLLDAGRTVPAAAPTPTGATDVDEDADLAGLLGDDDEGEVVFVGK